MSPIMGEGALTLPADVAHDIRPKVAQPLQLQPRRGVEGVEEPPVLVERAPPVLVHHADIRVAQAHAARGAVVVRHPARPDRRAERARGAADGEHGLRLRHAAVDPLERRQRVVHAVEADSAQLAVADVYVARAVRDVQVAVVAHGVGLVRRRRQARGAGRAGGRGQPDRQLRSTRWSVQVWKQAARSGRRENAHSACRRVPARAAALEVDDQPGRGAGPELEAELGAPAAARVAARRDRLPLAALRAQRRRQREEEDGAGESPRT